MENKINFGVWEATCMMLLMMGTKVILNYPRVVIEIAGTAGWIFTIYLSLLAALGFLIISKLYKKQDGKDLIEIGEYVGGKAGRIIIGILTAVYMIILVSSLLRLFTEQMKTMSYTDSPPSYIMMFFAIGIIFAAYKGIEPIVRFQSILVPVSVAAFTIFIILLAPYYDFTRILPLFGKGIPELIKNGPIRISEFSELVFLFLIVPFIGSHSNFKRIGLAGIGLSALFLTASTLGFLAVSTYPTMLETNLPTFQLGRIINYGRFFQRIESLFIVTWATMAFMYLSTAFYFLVYVFGKTFNLKYIKPLIPVFIILVIDISLIPRNVMEATILVVVKFRDTSGILTFGVTIILLLLANMKKRREEAKKC